MTTKSAGYIRKHNLLEIILTKWWFWLLFVAFFFAVPIWRSVNRSLPNPLPVLMKVESFELTNQFNEPFGTKYLKDRFAVVHFSPLECSSCVEKFKKMQVIQKRLRGLGQNVQIITITINPNLDTVERTFAMAQSLRANPYVWKFLTGKESDVREVVTDVFKAPMSLNEDGSLVYSEKLYLLDKKQNLRGLYTLEEESVNRLMIDIGLLANEAFTRE